MANLTKTNPIEEKTRPFRQDYPVLAGAITLYEGGLSAFNAVGNGKFLTKAADTVGFSFAGLNVEMLTQLAGGTNGDNNMRVIPKGSGIWIRVKSNTALTQADVGENVFMFDDQLVDTSATVQNIVVGVIRIVEDASFCFIEI